MNMNHNTDINHYAVLEVPFGASAKDIKKQYHKLALKYHPDKDPDVDRSIFQEITESFFALKDDKFRQIYDIVYYESVRDKKTCRQRKEKEQREREAKLQLEREKERQRQQCEQRVREARERKEEELRELREHYARERKEEELREREAKLHLEREKERQRQQCEEREEERQQQQREREAQVQRECENEQCKECECLKRKQVMDEQLSKKVVEELKKQVETLKSQLVESEKEVDTVMCELFESKNEHVAWKKQFWILNDKYEALQQKNMEMHGEIPDAEIQREAKRQRKADEPDGCREDITTNKPECCREDITAKLLQICANGVRHNTDAAGIEWYAVIDFMNRVCSGKDKKAVNRTWEYFRDKSKFKEEIAKFTRKIDFRYESTYSPWEDGLGRQNGTPAAQLSGLERMLTILVKDKVDPVFHNLVDMINKH